MAHLGLGYQVGQTQVGVGAGHEVTAVLLQQLLLDALSHAAKYADDEGAR